VIAYQSFSHIRHDCNISVSEQSLLLSDNRECSHLLFAREISKSELQQSSSPNAEADCAAPTVSLVKKKFLGKYAISAEEFSDEMVSYIIVCI
jgi:hypothetical protein